MSGEKKENAAGERESDYILNIDSHDSRRVPWGRCHRGTEPFMSLKYNNLQPPAGNTSASGETERLE